MWGIIKVFFAVLLVLGVMGYLVDYMNNVADEPKIVMCRVTDINKAYHEMPCQLVSEYIAEVNK
jgi:hypothetical protein